MPASALMLLLQSDLCAEFALCLDERAMYRIINANIDLILESRLLDQDIAKYLRLLEDFRETDVRNDTQFQSEYRSYWKMSTGELLRIICYNPPLMDFETVFPNAQW